MPELETIQAVHERLERWLGPPTRLVTSTLTLDDEVTPFACATYIHDSVFSTSIGAAVRPVPHSEHRYRDPRGMRHEYLIAHRPDQVGIPDMLRLLALYPFVESEFVFSGKHLHIPGARGLLEAEPACLFYLTDPFEHDDQLYTPDPHGQIIHPDFKIQFLWVIPIYRSEFQFLQTHGYQQFEETCLNPAVDYACPNRAPLV
ncbi:suppressor of fused domain protein [Deinococcus hohokamensis]|uniref:Suppressor of fused domain protein n=1 Tax=Deinococcus hohokamensis TaxID=309883 RepID=A0ABV9I8U8_9DEIO